MMETEIERAVTVALHGGASSINADAATQLLRVIAELRTRLGAADALVELYRNNWETEQRISAEIAAAREDTAEDAAQLRQERDALRQKWDDAASRLEALQDKLSGYGGLR